MAPSEALTSAAGRAVVHLALVEDVGEPVDVREDLAVEDEGDVLGGPLEHLDAGEERVAGVVAEGVALAGLDHVDQRVGGAHRHRAGEGDLARAGDADAFLHQRGGLLALLGRDQVERAEEVVIPPAPPVAQGVEVADHLVLRRWRPHRSASSSAASRPRASPRRCYTSAVPHPTRRGAVRSPLPPAGEGEVREILGRRSAVRPPLPWRERG